MVIAFITRIFAALRQPRAGVLALSQLGGHELKELDFTPGRHRFRGTRANERSKPLFRGSTVMATRPS